MANVVKKVPKRKLLVKKVAKTSFVTGKQVTAKKKQEKHITVISTLRGVSIEIDNETLFDVISETNQGCCGVEDVYDLTCLDIDIFARLSLSDKKEIVKKLDNVFSTRKEIKTREGNITYMLTTNNKEETEEWLELMKLSSLFIPVKTFRNINSRNMVTIWISNN